MARGRLRWRAVLSRLLATLAAFSSSCNYDDCRHWVNAQSVLPGSARLAIQAPLAFHGAAVWPGWLRFRYSPQKARRSPRRPYDFSQTSVNNVDEIAPSMRTNGWVGKPIDVVRMPDDGLGR